MPDESPPPDETLPDVIIDGLRALDRMPFEVSSEQHSDILNSARQHLNPVTRAQPVRRWRYIVALTGSVCAALLVFAFVQLDNHEQRPEQIEVVPELADTLREATYRDPKDIDADGKVDILDAYVMARRLQDHDLDETLSKWDFNGDGQLDEDDVQVVAFQAVML